MAVQTITFQLCSDPVVTQDFNVDTSVILTGDVIFADYQCWESTGIVSGGPPGSVIFTGYTGCTQCNNDFNGWEFEHCGIPGLYTYFGLKNSEVYQYFQSTGATISYDGTCYNFTQTYEQGTGSTTYNYTVAQLISENALYTDCASCLNPPSPTPTPTPSITPTPTPVCISGVTDGPSWFYTDCCGNYQSGSLFPSGVCVNTAYPYSGIAIFTGQICSPVCPSVTPTVTPTMTSTPSVTATPSITTTSSVTPTNSVTPTPSITPTPSSTMGSTPSVTPTVTPTSSVTPSVTPTSSITPSLTPTMSVTPSPSTIPSGCTQYTFTLQEIYFLNQAGPYNISGTTTGGTIVTIATGVTNTQLISGYTTLVCYAITGGTIQSAGACTNSVEYLVATPTPQPSPSPTPSITPTPTVTKTPTPTITPTITPSITPTLSVTPTRTPSITPTPSKTPDTTVSVTPSITTTSSVTPSVTPTPSISITPTPTPSSITISLVYQHQKLNSCSRTFGNIQKNGTTFYTWNTPFPVSTYSGTTTAHVGDLIDLSMDALGITSGCTALGYGCSVVGYSIVRNGVTVQTNTESSCGTGSINDTYLIPNSTTSLIIYITSDVTT